MDKCIETPLDRAIRSVGGQAALAKGCGVTPQAVNQWIAKKRVPVERVRAIELATGGAVARGELRPDVFGDRAA